MFPLVEKEEGPLPNELVGLIPKVKAPPELDAFSLNVPFDADSCSSAPPLSSKLVAPPNDVDCNAESKGPPTLKN